MQIIAKSQKIFFITNLDPKSSDLLFFIPS